MNTIAHIRNKYGVLDVISYALVKAFTAAMFALPFALGSMIVSSIPLIDAIAPELIEQATFFEISLIGFSTYILLTAIENYLHERKLARNGYQSENKGTSK